MIFIFRVVRTDKGHKYVIYSQTSLISASLIRMPHNPNPGVLPICSDKRGLTLYSVNR